MKVERSRYSMILQASWPIKTTVLALLIALTGCESPATRFHEHAASRGFEREKEDGLVLYKRGTLIDGQPIHFYIDGDGTPSMRRGGITNDPTSRDRLILDLIDVDPSSSILVGRPCYYGVSARCEREEWTTARYSIDVVDQLTAAINSIVATCPNSHVTVIGYSGGGTLAMLVAPFIDRLDSLITVAANLDTRAWLNHHRYSPLEGSLNPADQAPLRPAIRQFHFFGEKDKNVPVNLAEHVLHRQHDAHVEVVAGFDHRCCWPNIWAESIENIRRQTTNGN
jgi:hypothetical protein